MVNSVWYFENDVPYVTFIRASEKKLPNNLIAIQILDIWVIMVIVVISGG